jgi:DNA polymerase III epsilon subunit-like protein
MSNLVGGRKASVKKKEKKKRQERQQMKKKQSKDQTKEKPGGSSSSSSSSSRSSAKQKKKRRKQKMKRQGKGDGDNNNSTKSNWEQLRQTLGGKGKGKKNASWMPDSVRRSKKRKREGGSYAAVAGGGGSGAGPEGSVVGSGGGVATAAPAGDTDPSLYIACDAEMVGVGAADTSALARVSLTDWYGRVLYDKFVKPRGRITNYRTWVSGIRKRDLQHAMPFARARADVVALLKGKILVGHAVHNDLKCLETEHPGEMVRDTAQYPPLMRRNPATGKLQPRKLKDLSEQIGYAIQSGSHSSVEDAQATMRVYRHYRKEWDKWLDSGGKYVPPAVPDVKIGGSGDKKARGQSEKTSADPFASKHKKRRRQETGDA